jgi:rubrerythrin
MNNGEKYSGSSPYPSVSKDIEKDLNLAGCLNASKLSELQTISEYIYQSIVLEEKYPDIAKMLEKTAMVEMRHYKILSQLIYRLGGDSGLNNRIRTLPLDILYKSDCEAVQKIRKTLLKNKYEEDSAAKEYRRLSKLSDDRKISRILERIGEDEELHAENFDMLLRKFSF